MAPRGGGPDDMVAAYDSNDEHRDRDARRGDARAAAADVALASTPGAPATTSPVEPSGRHYRGRDML